MNFSLHNVTVRYERLPALRDISYEVHSGDLVLLTGQTGAGKSTLLRLLYGDVAADDGVVMVDGVDISTMSRRNIRDLRQRMGIVFQECRLIENKTIYENVGLPLYIRGLSRSEADKHTLEVLAESGISFLRNKFPWQLSGGERHLAALARALVKQPDVLVTDEVTGNLDSETRKKVAAIIREFHKGGRTVLMATHDIEMIEMFSDANTLELREGEVVHAHV